MALDYCFRHDWKWDGDQHEDCPKCMREPIADMHKAEVRWTVYPAIGDRAVFEMDCTYLLAWDETVGWAFDGVIVDDIEGEPLRIQRDGTIKLDDGWVQHSPVAMCIKIAAEHCFDAERDRITADLPSHWPVEEPDYTDRRFRFGAR